MNQRGMRAYKFTTTNLWRLPHCQGHTTRQARAELIAHARSAPVPHGLMRVIVVAVLSMLVASAQAFAPQVLPGTAGLSHRAGPHHRVLPASQPRVAALQSRSPVPVCAASGPQQQATLAASVIGLASQPVFWWSLYTLKTTGCAHHPHRPAHVPPPLHVSDEPWAVVACAVEAACTRCCSHRLEAAATH